MRLRCVFWLDVSLLFFFCALESVNFSGLVLHEWIGIAVIAVIVAHLLLSWTWIDSATRRLVAKSSLRARINYCLNWGLFFSACAVIYSGILISQDAIPSLTGKPAPELNAVFRWDYIHNRTSDIVVILASLHLAINWTWSAAAARKVLGGR